MGIRHERRGHDDTQEHEGLRVRSDRAALRHDARIQHERQQDRRHVHSRRRLSLPQSYAYDPVLKKLKAVYDLTQTNQVLWRGVEHYFDGYVNNATTLVADREENQWEKTVTQCDAAPPPD